ncbi:MAG: hypothetical protein AAF702_22460 [Chloroflexota bacterium]
MPKAQQLPILLTSLLFALAIAIGVILPDIAVASQTPEIQFSPSSPTADLIPLTNVVNISVGNEHACALTHSGGVKCWGNNVFGALGNGGTTVQSSPVDVSGLSSGVKELATGTHHTCALTTEGGVKCWGYNNWGQLGDGTTTSKFTPIDVGDLSSGVSAISAGYGHTCALIETSGNIKCWGYNITGQLGDGTTLDRHSPTTIEGIIGASDVKAGGNHTCALINRSNIKCWGANIVGQLGNGDTALSTTPVDVTGLSGSPISVNAGNSSTCAMIEETGGVQCWGWNSRGQLGDGSQANSIIPVDVDGLDSNVEAIAVAREHTCALMTDGGVKCWGYNRMGSLGNGTFTGSLTPVTPAGLTSGVSAISAGGYSTCALLNSGRVKCWGLNGSDQLGNGVPTFFTSPQLTIGLSGVISSTAGGLAHTCSLMTSGDVRCWGRNHVGQLGNGTSIAASEPEAVINLDGPVSSITSGYFHTCALLASDGSIKCWGHNEGFGQLGDGTGMNQSMPVTTANLEGGIKSIGAGVYHTCAVMASTGGVKCWGKNTSGELGDGTTTHRQVPTDVAALSDGVSEIAAGYGHTCALMGDGSVKCWGNNAYGQLGNNSWTSSPTPFDVIGLSGQATAITAGERFTCALMQLGNVKCWGLNANGELGNVTTTNSNIPIDVSGLPTSVVAIEAGEHHTCAQTSSGQMKCWGLNRFGQLGDGTTTDRNSPVDVMGLSGTVTGIDAGAFHTCAILNGTTMQCWGDATYGRLGTGRMVMSSVPIDVVVPDPCAGVTEIPEAECRALVALYNSTNGPNWLDKTGWLETSTPCSWFGITCIGNTVTKLELPDNRLQGAIPSQLGQLSGLSSLVLYNNQSVEENRNQLTGNLPKELGNLHNLTRILLSGNKLSGTIPPELGNLESLQSLQLQNNLTISGTIPSQLGNLSNLQSLYLHNNQLHGPIPSELGDLANLTILSLHRNRLSGQIPPEIGQLSKLRSLSLYDNQFAGPIPSELGLLSELIELLLYLNDLSGPIPPEIGDLSALKFLRLFENNLSGEIPETLGNLENLEELELDNNQLSGGVPSTFGNLQKLIELDLGDNVSLIGSLPVSLTNIPANQLSLFFTITNLCVPTELEEWIRQLKNLQPESYEPCPPSSDGDDYEADNICTDAKPIRTTGITQKHTFHQPNDTDWVKFEATAGTRYLIQATTPPTSTADVILNIIDTCDGEPLDDQDNSFSPDVHLEFSSPVTGTLYVKLANADSSISGPDAHYDLSVRELVTPTNRALIVVAGAIKDNDVVQPNIYNVTDQVRQVYLNQGYSDDNIYYLAPTDTLRRQRNGVDATATIANLKEAITTWAVDHVNSDGSLTLYLMDHGARDRLYLDKQQRQWVSPAEIDSWLDELEAEHPELKVNVIVEACFAGSFISASETTTDTVSSPGRAVIASTTDNSLAWTSPQGGANFSDHFLAELNRKSSLFTSFQKAQQAASEFHGSQWAWLDANGNGIPNESADEAIASQRGFGITNTLPDDQWPPTIFQVEGPAAIDNGKGRLSARVQDDVEVKHVWATIYPPTYQAPTEGEALVRDEDDESILTVKLTDADGDSTYTITYDNFDTPGDYRVVFYAEDEDGLTALPKSLMVTVGGAIYLPMVTR